MLDKSLNKYKHSENWFGFKPFYDYVLKLNYSSFVEIGVWKGSSISYLAQGLKKQNRSVRIYAVDLFEKWQDPEEAVKTHVPFVHDIYNQNLIEDGVRDMIVDIRGCSWEAVRWFDDNSLDFVFLDGNHSYEGVKKDITAWLPKIKSGGLISGHDYYNPCGVKKAVDELLKDFETSKESCVWHKQI